MRSSDIISLVKSHIILGVVGAVFIYILLLIGYFLIYKKILHGEKTLSRGKIFLTAILICYLIVIIDGVFLKRRNAWNRSINLPFLIS